MIEKPSMIVMPAHPTNTWDRLGTKFEYIVIHYVGAVSTARNNGQYYGSSPNLGASAHFFVDEKEIVSSVPLTLAAGHCGVDYSGGKAPYWNGTGKYSTNRRSIGIEMCCKKTASGQWYIEPETVTKTVQLVLWLMQEYDIPLERVITHHDVCWKNCPAPWVEHPEQWAAFKKRLNEEVYTVDITKAEFVKIVTETVNQTVSQVVYGDIKDVPDYWEGALQKMLDLKIIDGGTLASVNDHDVNMTRTEAKMAAILVRLFDAVFPGAIEKAIEEIAAKEE